LGVEKGLRAAAVGQAVVELTNFDVVVVDEAGAGPGGEARGGLEWEGTVGAEVEVEREGLREWCWTLGGMRELDARRALALAPEPEPEPEPVWCCCCCTGGWERECGVWCE
jgi:hypothetical protein